MELLGLYFNKPKSLGAGLKRVKKSFGVTGENLSNELGKRRYNCYDGNHTLDVASHGTPRNACLTIEVDKIKDKIKSLKLIGRISDITKTYSRKAIYKDGIIGQYHEKRTATEKFDANKQSPFLDRIITDVKKKTKVIEPWYFDRIEY